MIPFPRIKKFDGPTKLQKILPTNEDKFLINSRSVQQQNNGHDCDLFAIAFIIYLANKRPVIICYDPKELHKIC